MTRWHRAKDSLPWQSRDGKESFALTLPFAIARDGKESFALTLPWQRVFCPVPSRRVIQKTLCASFKRLFAIAIKECSRDGKESFALTLPFAIAST